MTRYLLSVHTPVGEPQMPMDEEQIREVSARILAIEDEMKSVDALVFTGRLEEPDAARVVRSTNGQTLTTDGPFIEAKEAIGGFYIIQAASLDAALEWASKTSTAIGMPIEVRPFLDSHGA
jgi:hypothetical protein